MATIKQAYENWTELAIMFEIMAIDTMIEGKQEAEDLNRSQLYDFGIKASGVELPPYSQFTVFIKRLKGQITDHMTLKDTGAFHKSFTAIREDNGIKMEATDGKTQELTTRYGADILGLTDGSKASFFTTIRPTFFSKIRKILNYGR